MTNNSKKLKASKLLVFEFFNSQGWEWPGERSPTCRCNLSNIYKCNSDNPDVKEVKDCRSIFTALVLKSWRNQQTGWLFPNMCEVRSHLGTYDEALVGRSFTWPRLHDKHLQDVTIAWHTIAWQACAWNAFEWQKYQNHDGTKPWHTLTRRE